MRSHRGALALVGVVAALSVVGCAGGDEKSNAKPQRGGTLTIAQPHDITGFDQVQMVDNESIRVVSQITEPLFKTDRDGNVRPWLATSDRRSDGGRTRTFELRPGVKFSDGKPLTSADVKFTIEQARKSPTWSFIMGNVKAVETPASDTVVVRLKEPSASLQAELALFVNGIVPADWGGKSQSEFAQHPIGTGPFVLGSWDKGNKVVLERNPGYWRKGKPLLDKVELIGVPDDNSRVTQLRGQQVDVAANPPWPQLEALDNTPGLRVAEFAPARVDAIRLNTKQPPLDDPRVRQAISLAIDRQAIVRTSLSGRGEIAKSFLASSLPFYAASLPDAERQDANRAKELVRQAGATGEEIEMNLIAGDSVGSTIGQIVQEDLEAIGLEVELRPLDQSAGVEQTQKGDYAAAVTYITSDIQDPSELVAYYVGTEGYFTFADTKQVGALAVRAAQELDEAKRAELYAEIQRQVVGEYGFIPVQLEPWIYGVRDRVSGFTVNATGIFDLADVGLAPGS